MTASANGEPRVEERDVGGRDLVEEFASRSMVASSEVKDPLVGRVIAEKYRLEAVAGTGATGSVYRAMHLTLGKPLAVKVLAKHLMANPTAQARFRREALAASKLDHPNSVHVVDFGTEPDGVTYLAMELLEGRELYRAIFEDWPLGPERSARILGQVLSVLQAAHELGIVHRDLKPENVMLVQRTDEDGNTSEIVKVADFGIAKSIAPGAGEEGVNLTREGIVQGTPEYMSPEQARGEELDGRADLYACGVILYEMLTGTLPFTAQSAIETILKHLSDPVEPPTRRRPDCDRRLEPVVMKALAKKREDRYQDARSMRAALVEALRAEEVPSARASATPAGVAAAASAAVGSSVHVSSAPSLPPGESATAVPLMRKSGGHLPTETLASVSSKPSGGSALAPPSDTVPSPTRSSPSGALAPWKLVVVVASLLGAVLVGAWMAGAFHPRAAASSGVR
jgi:serine/threonine protein kinase